jgi:hypothetical protein
MLLEAPQNLKLITTLRYAMFKTILVIASLAVAPAFAADLKTKKGAETDRSTTEKTTTEKSTTDEGNTGSGTENRWKAPAEKRTVPEREIR